MERTAGLGFKLEHLDPALRCRDSGLWFEVHSENYMVEGGPRLAALDELRMHHPVALHGVGLSIASIEPPEAQHLQRLAALADRVEPAAVSDHLAWQRWRGVHHADFLPFPRTLEALAIVEENVDRVQTGLRRQLLVENPSLYVGLPGHEMTEAEFLGELAARTGCGLLLDVNNLYVSAVNLGLDPNSCLDAFPAEPVHEIHLAGHGDPGPGSPLLIDTHGAPVAESVWALYARLVGRIGPRPTLIERDDDIPPFEVLLAERGRAHGVLAPAATAIAHV